MSDFVVIADDEESTVSVSSDQLVVDVVDELFSLSVTEDVTTVVVDEEAFVVQVDSDEFEVLTIAEQGPSGPPGPQGPAGLDGGVTGQVTLERVAGEDLSGHRGVVAAADGTVVYASNLDAQNHRPVWITTGAALTGETVTVVASGSMTEPSWSWAAGVPVWLGTNGTLTQTLPNPPSSIIEVGVTETATQLFVRSTSPIVSI